MRWRLRRFISSLVQRRVGSSHRRTLKRAKAEITRQREGRQHQVFYFHQLDDPYSHLMAQKIADFVLRFDIDFIPHLVGPPPSDAVPQAEMLKAYARLDASRIAPFYGVIFDKDWQTPNAADQLKAARVLTKNHGSYLKDISTALWSGDGAALDSYPQASEEEAQDWIKKGTHLRKKWGHYSGAMLYYEGEWYWGIDRLNYLEKRLKHLGASRPFVVKADASLRTSTIPVYLDSFAKDGGAGSDTPKLQLEYYPSLRSPYSYLSVQETLELERLYPIEIIMRPVMPMVMRGLKVPRDKGLYIIFDTLREAEKRYLPFHMLDPVGPPILRGFSLYPYAKKHGKEKEYIRNFLTAAFGEGKDIYSKKGLHDVVYNSGLIWTEAKQDLDKQDFMPELEENAAAMFAVGCWGVPSYRLLGDGANSDSAGTKGEEDFVVWGNDRIWLLKEEIVRRLRAAD